MPAEGQQPVRFERAVVDEVPQHTGRGTPEQPGLGRSGHRADPERRRGGEPVGEAAALHERGSVGAEQRHRVLEVPA